MANVKEPLRLSTMTMLHPWEMTREETNAFEWFLGQEIRELETEIDRICRENPNIGTGLTFHIGVSEMNAYIDELKADLDDLRSVA